MITTKHVTWFASRTWIETPESSDTEAGRDDAEGPSHDRIDDDNGNDDGSNTESHSEIPAEAVTNGSRDGEMRL